MTTPSRLPSTDPFDLKRFESAQEGIYKVALAELRRGEKESHWMWFIFPQIDGLGSSYTAQHYSIKSRDEALAYLVHAILGQRLVQCAETLLQVEGKSANRIMGFHRVLDKYFKGHPDSQTLELLAAL